MKTALAIIALLSALSTTPMLAANHDKAPASVEARLVQADLSVTLQQYEKVKRLTGEAALQAALLDGSDPKQSEALAKRIGILRQHADKLRSEALRYEAEIRLIREGASAGKPK
ncbi:hypothetical protein LBMAG56_06070 [Verrucomicrobiota bacterium]|nr:hypothetical protein LBMAG56_06070 [Verrucomicrobiota bacterium]